MLDPAEIPLRLEQALSYLSFNNQICERFAVLDCECFLFNTRDANYEQDQHHVKMVNADKKGCLIACWHLSDFHGSNLVTPNNNAHFHCVCAS